MNNELNNKIVHLGNIVNSNTHAILNTIQAIITTLESEHPGFTEDFEKEKFYSQCVSVFTATKQARQDGGPNALIIIANNTKALTDMKKTAKDRGWLSAYHKADRNSEHLLEESERSGPKVVKP